MSSTAELAQAAPSGEVPAGALDATATAQLLDLAERGFQRGEGEDARAVLHGLVVVDRTNAAAWALLGRVERSLDRLKDARAALERAVALSRRDFDLALELAEVDAQLGAAEPAQALLSWVTLESEGLTREQLERVRRIDAATKAGA